MTTSIQIREARAADRDRVGELWMQLLESMHTLDTRLGPSEDALARWRNSYDRFLQDRSCRLFVAEMEGEVVGFQSAETWYPAPVYAGSMEVHLNELYVVPMARRQGVATALFEAARGWASEIGASRLRMGVLARNESARRFCERQGAVPFVSTLTVELDPAQASMPPRAMLGFAL